MKKHIAFLLILILALTAASCGKENTNTLITPPLPESTTELSVPEDALAELLARFTEDVRALSAEAPMTSLDSEYSLLNTYPDWVGDAAKAEIDKIYSDLLADSIDSAKAEAMASAFALLSGAKRDAVDCKAMIAHIQGGRDNYQEALTYIDIKEFRAAAIALSGLSADDKLYIEKAKELIAANKADIESGISAQIDSFLSANAKEAANQFLSAYAGLYGEDAFIKAQLERVK